jgi:hypothetical protein
MRQLLGVRQLPPEGMAAREIDGVRVYVRAQRPLRERERHRSSHRIMAICTCGRHVPVGRLHQHTCKGV